ncbi:hypothetical protein YC2023_073096 [Brassica napus]
MLPCSCRVTADLRICFLRTSYFLLSGSKEDNLSFILKNWGKTYQLLYGEDTEEKDKKCHLVQCRVSGRKSLVGFKDGGDLDHFCTNLSSNKLLLIFNKKCTKDLKILNSVPEEDCLYYKLLYGTYTERIKKRQWSVKGDSDMGCFCMRIRKKHVKYKKQLVVVKKGGNRPNLFDS